MGCNGICHRYKAKKQNNVGRYASGQKRCNVCNMYLNWEGLFCPCCNLRIRMNSRYSKLKEKHLEFERI